MKNVLCLLVFFLFGGISYSQNKIIDSLTQVLNNSKTDTAKIDAFLNLAAEFKNSDRKKTLEYADKALSLAEKSQFQRGIASCKYFYGFLAYSQGDFAKAKIYYTEALTIFKALKIKKMTGKMIYNLGIVAIFQGDYKTGLSNFFEAQKIYEALGNKEDISDAAIAIANVYGRLGNIEKELEYHEKALAMKKELGDKYGIAAAYLNIGAVYTKQKNYKKALEASKICLKLSEETNNKKWLINANGNIGLIYYEMKNFQESIPYCLKSLQIAEEIGDKGALCIEYNNLGNVYLKMGNFQKAKESFDKGLRLAIEVGDKNEIKTSYENFAEFYSSQENYKDALKFTKFYMNTKDSILNEETTNMMNELQTKYDTEKKEQEILLLNKDKQIQQTNLNKQKLITSIVITALGIVTLLIFFVFRQYMQKQKANVKLELAYKQIEEKNKDITDSINYARRIQSAMLPSNEQVQNALPQSLILYKPKDIVSGDFYWMSQKGNEVFIAVADCTGHGVPGAFMSMIGNDLLNHIIIEKNILRPSEILDALHIGIQNALKQNEKNSQTRDGMDIGLCRINFKENKLEFAGAQRPLYIIKSTGELMEVKGDKFPIGGADINEQKNFFNHEIVLEANSLLYLSSDGYADQFGGSEGKKFMTKRMKDLLKSISKKTMSEQLVELEEAYIKWKGNNEQVDDVLVIGIRV